jgi:SAM-dependent methyltransferase
MGTRSNLSRAYHALLDRHPPITKSDVIWAYRVFLGRRPENERVVREHCRASNLRALCETFIDSAEFKLKAGTAGNGRFREPLPIFLPPLSVDTLADSEELRQLWDRVRRAWESLGNDRPFHSVLTQDRYLPSQFSDAAAEFWQSGEVEAWDLAGHLAGLGLVRLEDAVALEFGCGVGRVAIPLAAIARSVIAYDISERHLEFARKRAAALGRANMQIIAIGGGLPADFEPCDVFYSRLVLQHSPPPIIGEVIRRLIRSLKQGGVGVFQVPTYCVGYRFSIAESLRSPIKLDMDMHCYPQASLFSLIADEGARLIHVRDDDAPGRRDLFVSNTFVITK